MAKEFVLAASVDVESLEPYTPVESATFFFLQNIYDGLVRFDTNLKIEPALATSWKLVDPKLWRFTLRKNVKFHNGDPFTADDVVFSFKRTKAPTSGIGWAVSSIDEVVKVDDFTVDIKLKAPDVVLLNEIANVAILNAKWTTANNAAEPADRSKNQENFLARNANGTGAFKLVSREPGARTELAVNPDWWDTPRHNLTKVVFQPIASDATRVAALMSKRVDLIDPIPLQDIAQLGRAQGIAVVKGPSVRSVFLGMDQKSAELAGSGVSGKNPFKDRRVRLAMYQAIDVETIRNKVMFGAATPTATIIAPGLAGYDPSFKRYPYDPEAARKLLAEAGYPQGFSAVLDCPTASEISNVEAICQALVPMWARVGIKVTLNAQPRAKFAEKMLKGESQIYIASIGSANVKDGSSVLNNALHSPTGRLGMFNPGGYANKVVDDASLAVAAEIDPAKRQVAFTAAQKAVHDDVGILPLHQQNVIWGVVNGSTLPQTPDGHIRLWAVQKQ